MIASSIFIITKWVNTPNYGRKSKTCTHSCFFSEITFKSSNCVQLETVTNRLISQSYCYVTTIKSVSLTHYTCIYIRMTYIICIVYVLKFWQNNIDKHRKPSLIHRKLLPKKLNTNQFEYQGVGCEIYSNQAFLIERVEI